MAKPLSKARIKLLIAIVAAGASGMYASVKDAEELQSRNLVETNPEMTNDNGEIAVRATQEGIDEAAKHAEPAPGGEETTSEAEPGFELEDNVEVPPVRQRRASASKYPFDKMEVDQSFFVPQPDGEKDIVRRMSSIVSNAKKRYAEEIPGEFKQTKNGQVPKLKYNRDFTCRPAEKDGVKGVRVWRTL